jgi:hypothetical protein
VDRTALHCPAGTAWLVYTEALEAAVWTRDNVAFSIVMP